jgi:glycosidase
MPRELESDHRTYGVTGDLYPRDVRFDPGEASHLSRLDEERLFFRLLTEDSFTEALLVTRTRGRVVAHEMARFPGAGRFAVWELEFADPGVEFEYSFALQTTARSATYLAPSGITNAVERLDRWHVDPQQLRTHETPAWAKGTTMYQIFPDRFAAGTDSPDNAQLAEWGAAPHPHEFQGGDLAGIAQKAEYLADLGVEAVYLNPIFTSPSNHRYDAIDYFSVDPMLGGNEAFAAMVTKLHQHDIRVVLDTSLNHCHPRFFAFADIMENGADSAYNGWFEVFDFPTRVRYRPQAAGTGGSRAEWARQRARTLPEETGLTLEEVAGDGPLFEPTFDAWYGVPTMPRVNLAHPEARQYMLDVAAHWVREYDIDGWRMDVARYVDTDFWNDFRDAVKAVKPDAYLVAEVMGDSGIWLQGDRFDATMNYTFRDLCLEYFATDAIDTAAFLDGYTRMHAMYSPAVSAVNFNLLSSHDTPRFLSQAGDDKDRLLLATLFQLTVPGAASVYYGDEVGLSGGEDPGSRGAFPRQIPAAVADLLSDFRSLIRLRRDSEAIRTGRWELGHVHEEAFAYRRVSGSETLAVAINNSDAAVDLPLGTSREVHHVWGPGTTSNDGGQAWVRDLPARRGAVVRL